MINISKTIKIKPWGLIPGVDFFTPPYAYMYVHTCTCMYLHTCVYPHAIMNVADGNENQQSIGLWVPQVMAAWGGIMWGVYLRLSHADRVGAELESGTAGAGPGVCKPSVKLGLSGSQALRHPGSARS